MSWLTKFLGFDEIIVAKDGEIVNLYTQLHRKDEQLLMKDQEIRRLTDLMLVEHGVIHNNIPESEQAPKNPQAVNKRSSWSQVRKRFEDTDAQLAKNRSTQLHDYWSGKDKEAAREVS